MQRVYLVMSDAEVLRARVTRSLPNRDGYNFQEDAIDAFFEDNDSQVSFAALQLVQIEISGREYRIVDTTSLEDIIASQAMLARIQAEIAMDPDAAAFMNQLNEANGFAEPVRPEVVMPEDDRGDLTTEIDVAEEEGKIEIPEGLKCPLTLSIFHSPVTAPAKIRAKQTTAEGEEVDVTVKIIHQRFERSYLNAALAANPQNPFTREPLKAEDLLETPETKARVREFKENFKKKQ